MFLSLNFRVLYNVTSSSHVYCYVLYGGLSRPSECPAGTTPPSLEIIYRHVYSIDSNFNYDDPGGLIILEPGGKEVTWSDVGVSHQAQHETITRERFLHLTSPLPKANYWSYSVVVHTIGGLRPSHTV